MRSFSFLFLFFLPLFIYSQNLKDSIQSLDEYFIKVMKDWNVPQMAYGVVKDSHIVHARGFGYRDRENKLPVDENTLFKIASTSKGFTSLTFGIMADSMNISLDTPIRDILTDFIMYNDYVTKYVTPRDLLTNRTGLPRHGFIFYGTDLTRNEIASVLPYLDPVTSFREKHIYTNLMYMMVAHVIENSLKSPWEEFTRENLFVPLEMNNSSFGIDLFKKANHAIPYYYDKENKLFVKSELDDLMYSNHSLNPAGGINSNVKEMCNYMIMLLNDGKFNGKQVISKNYITQVFSPHVGSGNVNYKRSTYSLGHGLGWYINHFHGKTQFEFGGRTSNYDSRIILFPEDSIGIIVLMGANSVANFIISETLAENVIGESFFDWNDYGLNNPRWQPREYNKERNDGLNIEMPPTLNLQDYIGKFYHPAYGEIEIIYKNNRLWGKRSVVEFGLDHSENDSFLLNLEETTYHYKTLYFNLNEENIVVSLSVDFESRLPPIKFDKMGI